MEIQAVQNARQHRLRSSEQLLKKASPRRSGWMPQPARSSQTQLLLCWLAVWFSCSIRCDAQDATAIPNGAAKGLVGIYTHDVDNKAWGLLDIVKSEKGHSYISQGEHGIRAGIAISPTRVTFTGWGFAEGGRPFSTAILGQFRVVCTWLCYKNDYGEEVALPDEHTLTPLTDNVLKGKNIPDLGEMGMSAQQMEKVCGAPVEPPGPDSKYPHVTRALYRKNGYELNCLFYDDKVFSSTFWRSDNTAASASDKLVWLLQNGAQWKYWRPASSNASGDSHEYSGADGRLAGYIRWMESDKGAKYDVLEVRDTKVHPGKSYRGDPGASPRSDAQRSSDADPNTPVSRYQKVVEKAVSSSWEEGIRRDESSIRLGTAVKVHFAVDVSGRISDARLLEGDADGPLADITLTAIKTTKVPPMPKDVASTLNNKPLEVEYTFNVTQ